MSKQEYYEMLDLIEELDPQNTMLGQLGKGPLPINMIYIKKVVAKIKLPAPARTQKKAADDPQLQRLYMRKGALFGQRAKLSNQFHLPENNSNKKRGAISDEIQEIQKKIEAILKTIAYYEKHGKLPARARNEKYPVPDDPYNRMKKRNSIRASISRYRSDLNKLGALPDADPEREKIPDVERKLKDKQIYLQYVEDAINEAAVYG